ncbi:hypothetical protein [Pedobacter sp. ASV28]|uniref:hypothetical protein n=1 Tax=Pedobacter sp. ASV28 TaxID=2795123 RepID=UPI0018ED6F3B|nr:hypothetical protein [Pedobacter sp. ASV28]
MKKNIILLAGLALFLIINACDRTEDPIYKKISDNRFPTIVANSNFVTPTIPTAGIAKGTALAIELDFISIDPIKEIQFYEKIGTADSVLIDKKPYQAAFSKIKNCDTLLYAYKAPTTPATGTTIVFRARVVNQSGLTKDRILSYKVL